MVGHWESRQRCVAARSTALLRPRSSGLRAARAGTGPFCGGGRRFRCAPDFELVNGTKLGELLRNGRGVFLDFDLRTPLRSLANGWNDRVTYVASDAKDRLGLTAVLVRPDGFVAWAGEVASNLEEAAQAASRWFGEPEEVPESA
jgi:hypothetical protein